jgi:hypothetical protein
MFLLQKQKKLDRREKKMKKLYSTPSVEMIKFAAMDITTSTPGTTFDSEFTVEDDGEGINEINNF